MIEYLLRINGAPVRWYTMFSAEVIEDFITTQKANEDARVDVVQVSNVTIMSSYEYGQFRRHFKEAGQ